MDWRPYINIAEKAALEAGTIMLQKTRDLHRLTIYAKAENDFVSEVDIACEEIVIEHIQKAYPEHAILSEEKGFNEVKGSDYCWVIDPLDGTTNFLHGFPFFAVSIGLLHRQKPVVGVIFDPVHNELFVAGQGQGATLNQRKIRVNKKKEISAALIGTGIPCQHNQNVDVYLANIRSLITQSASIRRAGAAALDLCYVAAGRLDAFWEFGLKSWDITAGTVIVQEAGGMVGDMAGGFTHLETGNILAANSVLFKTLLNEFQTEPSD